MPWLLDKLFIKEEKWGESAIQQLQPTHHHQSTKGEAKASENWKPVLATYVRNLWQAVKEETRKRIL